MSYSPGDLSEQLFVEVVSRAFREYDMRLDKIEAELKNRRPWWKFWRLK